MEARQMSDIMTAVEVAELLRVHPKTLYRAAKRGQVPCRFLGRKMIFSRSAIEAWLSAGDARAA
jgi:excisionase family DNA binding protein